MTVYKQVKFFKYQGAGNDFIFFEDFADKFNEEIVSLIPALCDRNYGIGADGVIILQSSVIATTKMRIFNSDGCEAEMCGNGLRCTVAHLKKAEVTVETKAGICLGKNTESGVVVTLPSAEVIMSPIALQNNQVGHLIDTGVPHLIIIVDSLEDPEFESKARALRNHKMFAPDGVNVSYITSCDGSIYIRTYERGVESETLACGTACAASVLVMRKYDKKKKSMYTVYPKSLKKLHFSFDNQERIWMAGPALLVFQGEIQLCLDDKMKCKFTTMRG